MKTARPKIAIDPEFQRLIPALTTEERQELERSILLEGCRDSLVVWKETGILVDGHNRLSICEANDIAFNVVYRSFADRLDAKLWIIRNQLGRRNIDTLTRIELGVALEEAIAERAKAQQLANLKKGAEHPVLLNSAKRGTPQPPITPIHTRVEASRAAGVAPFTYDAGKRVLATGTEKLKKAIREGTASISAAAEIAALPATKQDEIVEKGEKAIVAAAKEARHHRTQFTGENEWYTPSVYIDAAREVMGAIDLDPASSEFAQKKVLAETFFTIDDDGLKKDWKGRVWLNPPYAQPAIEDFVRKLVLECRREDVTEAIMLTHNYTDTAWFQHAARDCAAICFTRGRIRFESPTGRLAAPTQGQAFFYFGKNIARFRAVFSQFGFVVSTFND